MRTHDVIVVGLGAMGSAAALQLARRGTRVLGLDTYPPGHDRGSSHGKTRIIRSAYYESPEYVPLVQRAWELWRQIEEESGRQLLRITGGLYLGRPECELVAGALASARQHGLPHELLDAEAARQRFPGLAVADDEVALYEPAAGLLDPEAAVAAQRELAQAAGATLRYSTPVERWSAEGSGVRVTLRSGEEVSADRLILAAGAWMRQLVPELPLTVWRILHVHFAPTATGRYAAEYFPFALWQNERGIYSAFPELPGQGVKFGRHDTGEVCSPETARRTASEAEIEVLRQELERYWPGAGGPVLWYLTCLYTMTPDHHFIIDRHPAAPQVVLCSACSGHGFKFASAIGELLAELALDSRAEAPALFRLARLGRRSRESEVSQRSND